jgi:hypothetical protein
MNMDRDATIHRGAPETVILTAKSILDLQQSKFGSVQYTRIKLCTTCLFSSPIFSTRSAIG